LAADDAKHENDENPSEHATITVDDPTRLTAAQRAVQLIAGRASIYAMLNILTILLVDAKILGSLQDRAAGSGKTQFFLLLASAGLKLFFAQRTYAIARTAAEESAKTNETVYVRNARGAKIATLVCGVVSVLVLAFAGKLAF
jgi:PAT family beta-lactamase induction signal transducer AmpG